jgi:hypothetical protein
MIHDIFSQLFLAVFVAAYLVFLAALAWWALGGRFRFALKPRLVPALSSRTEEFRAAGKSKTPRLERSKVEPHHKCFAEHP